ncbi:type III secretion system protein [Trinickia dinghuensis]|uniref:type III secretion system protein n=1 Tax=Trinickia dinghuensis TaxID=2291023 RepID=UPI0011C05FC2|nr:type III secretion system protein [Trinickia dinghuensis]
MYEALEAIRDELKRLPAMLASDDATSRVRRVSEAFDQTIRLIAERPRDVAGEAQRAQLQTLYRGLLAASRLVQRLHELPNPGQAAPL